MGLGGKAGSARRARAVRQVLHIGPGHATFATWILAALVCTQRARAVKRQRSAQHARAVKWDLSMTSLHVFQKPTVQRQILWKNCDGRHQRAENFDPPTGQKTERSCGVAEGPEVLVSLARPVE